jgi:hypothetical protein
MMRWRRFSISFRRRLWFVVGLGLITTAGCGGDTNQPKVNPGDSSTTYKVPPPPPLENGKVVTSPSKGAIPKGTMSARELRDFKKKQRGEQP